MRESSDSKRAVLDAVRRALGAGMEARSAERRIREYEGIARQYTAAQFACGAEVLALYEDRLRDYDAKTQRCAPAELAAAIAGCLRARGASRIVIAEDLPEEWLPFGFDFVRDRGLSYDAIDRADGVLTACSAAIALTGTIILQEGALAQGRRVLTLLPDYHLCVVDARQIVHTVPEGIRAIEVTAALATTTISGPSATADIEMIRIRGVHGPRTLEVIIVMPEASHGNGD